MNGPSLFDLPPVAAIDVDTSPRCAACGTVLPSRDRARRTCALCTVRGIEAPDLFATPPQEEPMHAHETITTPQRGWWIAGDHCEHVTTSNTEADAIEADHERRDDPPRRELVELAAHAYCHGCDRDVTAYRFAERDAGWTCPRCAEPIICAWCGYELDERGTCTNDEPADA